MKSIKRYIAIFAALVAATSTLSAQTSSSDGSGIAIMVVTPSEADGLPVAAAPALKNKMNQMATAAGLGSMDKVSQFCMLASVDVENKDVVAGAPPKFSQTLNFNFYIVDQFDQKVFSTASVRVKGIGNSEIKALTQAISGINVRSKGLANFVAEGKQKIVDYYTQNCAQIIAKAYSLAKLAKYEEALFFLTQVPDACPECYMHATAASVEIYDLYLDRLCSSNLAKAKALWGANQTATGALEAGAFLAEISPEARCWEDAEVLFEEMKAVVKDDKDFERSMLVEKWEFSKEQWKDSVDLEGQSIEAARQVGIAWGENQQPITNNPVWLTH